MSCSDVFPNLLTMLNLKITVRRNNEDYVAVQKNTGILPVSGRHFVGILTVCVISLVCALPFGNLVPLSIDASPLIAMLNKTPVQSAEQSYIQNDQDNTDQVEIAADAGSRENYDDAVIPSDFFSQQALAEAVLGSEGKSEDNAESSYTPLQAPPGHRERFTAQNENQAAQSTVAEQGTDITEASKENGNDTKIIADGSAEINKNTSEQQELSKESVTPQAPVLADAKESEDLKTVLGNAVPKLGNSQDEVKELKNDKANQVLSLLQSDGLPVLSALQTYVPSDDDDIDEQKRPDGSWYKQTVHKGDNISTIFNYLNLPNGTLAQITKVALKNDLSLQIGQQLHFLIDDHNNVLELVNPLNDKEQVRFTRLNPKEAFSVVHEPVNAHVQSVKSIATFAEAEKMPNAVEAAKDRAKAEEEAKLLAKQEAEQAKKDAKSRPRLLVVQMRRGENFKTAAKRAGLTASNIATLRQALSGKVNLNHLATGDTFRVLFNHIGTSSSITALEFNSSRNGKVSLFRHPDTGTLYEEHGYKPTTGVFRRFPVNGNLQVSSHFNPRRFNPVRRKISPHNGIDLRMPIGTSVFAPSDGIVTYAGFMRGGGYTVIIKHMGAYSTVYMHLSKLNVSKGQRVHLGQQIAKSGNTGRSTGPHLHYEIRINDRSVDPLKVDLPAGSQSLVAERRQKFQSTVKVLKSDLYKDSLAMRRQ